MKKRETAEFENVDIEATSERGTVSVLALKPKHDGPCLIEKDDVLELYQWLGELLHLSGHSSPPAPVTGRNVQPVKEPAADDSLKPPFREGLAPLDERGMVPILDANGKVIGMTQAPNHISDAESVKNRPKLEQILKAQGMKLENKDVTPQTVTFSRGGPIKAE